MNGRACPTMPLAVMDKTMVNLLTCLREFIATTLKKSQEKLKPKQTVSLAKKITKNDKLDEYDEAILRLKEVFPQFSCQVPRNIKDAFIKICKEKEIPAVDDKGKDKEFFVFSEIKTLRKICDTLSEEQAWQMYNKLMTRKIDDFREKSAGKSLSKLEVSLSNLKNIKGMKEASFYCFVVGLSKEGLLNRVHTHHLYNYLKNEDKTDAASHFQSALNMYPLASKPPGICIIFNLEKDCRGAEMDLVKVEELFRETFKYDVVAVKNSTRQGVSDVIKELKADRNKFYDSLVVVFMSHGDEHFLKLADGDMLHRRKDLIEPITNIDMLVKKPKLFSQQACAGIPEVQKEQGEDNLFFLSLSLKYN
ncbi:hypothetical protein GWK47_030951 [Chionoecetes opilio]|uniref:Caspase family p20 domain-containing protein n=1 Tax=Chionoecetes opilio TaxID=41210 RepID=A0A8J4YJS6_CHIOP|nr:hypothetical protein GWK47_030951 [Chionoecetes opilio]